MKVLNVPDMKCEMCEKRISKAFSEEGIDFKINLSEKTVSVEDGKVNEAKELLEDLGFTVL